MAYLIFHYKMELNYGCFYPAAEHPRDYLSARVLAAYDDGKIIAYDRNCLNEKFNERTICENISVTNQIDKIIKDNKWKIRFIPRNLGFWAFEGSSEYLPEAPKSAPYHQNYQIHASGFLILHTDNAVLNLQAVCPMWAFSSKTAHHRKCHLSAFL